MRVQKYMAVMYHATGYAISQYYLILQAQVLIEQFFLQQKLLLLQVHIHTYMQTTDVKNGNISRGT